MCTSISLGFYRLVTTRIYSVKIERSMKYGEPRNVWYEKNQNIEYFSMSNREIHKSVVKWDFRECDGRVYDRKLFWSDVLHRVNGKNIRRVLKNRQRDRKPYYVNWKVERMLRGSYGRNRFPCRWNTINFCLHREEEMRPIAKASVILRARLVLGLKMPRMDQGYDQFL